MLLVCQSFTKNMACWDIVNECTVCFCASFLFVVISGGMCDAAFVQGVVYAANWFVHC